jgi:hypothetical protein
MDDTWLFDSIPLMDKDKLAVEASSGMSEGNFL